MERSIKMMNKGFESSSEKTKEFMDFVKVFKKEFKSLLKEVGCTNFKTHVGHFELSGFFKAPDGIVRYWSLPDVRDGSTSIMIRYASGYDDYTGGSNEWYDLLDWKNTESIKSIINNTRF